jgi:hypothetical protein
MKTFMHKKNISYFTFLLLSFIFLNENINAQLIQSKSIEFDFIGASKPEYRIFPLKNGGFILQEQSIENYGNDKTIWQTKKYSENMDLLWALNIEIPSEVDFGDDFINKNYLYEYFTTHNSSKVNLLKIDLEKGDAEWINIDLVGIQDVLQMKIVENGAFFYGKFQGRAVVMQYSIFDKTIKALNGLYSNHTEVLEMDADEENKELHVYTKNRYKGKCQLQLNIYDKNGGKLQSLPIENDTKKMPFSGRLKKQNENESLIIGTYARLCDNFSQGIYVKNLNDNEVVRSKFWDFSEFNNFFKYLNPKRQKKIKEKLSKRKEAGKDLKFNYSMLVHKLYNFNNQLVMVAEIFYTETKSINGGQLYVANKDFTPYIYKFTHAIICGFDNEGNKLWDNCVPMKSLNSSYLNEQVQITQVGKNLILAYPEEGKIKTQVIDEDKTIREKEVFVVIPKKESFWDDDSNGGLSAWYDQNYLFWGYKTIADPNNITGRKVFFINKLSYKL